MPSATSVRDTELMITSGSRAMVVPVIVIPLPAVRVSCLPPNARVIVEAYDASSLIAVANLLSVSSAIGALSTKLFIAFVISVGVAYVLEASDCVKYVDEAELCVKYVLEASEVVRYEPKED